MAIAGVTQHRAFIYDRGGFGPALHQLEEISEVQWGRVRDDISEAHVYLTATEGSTQAAGLEAIEPGRHEMVIFRGLERVWEGPITRILITRDKFQIFAKDVCHYLYTTIMHSKWDNSYPRTSFVIERMRKIIVKELGRKEALDPPYNVLPFLTDHQTSTDARTSRKTQKYQITVWEEMDELAAKAGMDYTAVGRAIHLWDTSKNLGMAPMCSEADFIGDLAVTIYGMELGTRSVATDGQGNYGIAGGIDPYYGEIERLETAYDEEKDEKAPSTAELKSQAVRNLANRNPTPVQVRIPDNSTLNMDGVLGVEHLVPGVYIPLQVTVGIRKISQMQKLDKVTFTETSKGEVITVTLSPASLNDDTGEDDE